MPWNRGGHEATQEFKWNADKLLKYCGDAGFYGCVRAAYFLRGYIRNMIGVFGTPENPSSPGEPPHIVTGKLKDSIKVLTDNHRSEAIVYTDLEYWFYLEYGTKRHGEHGEAEGTSNWLMAPRPFWRRSIEETASVLPQITRQAMLEYMGSGLVRRNFSPDDVQFGESGET